METGFDPWRRKWQPTVVFLPGKSHGQRSLLGHSPWARIKWGTVEYTYVVKEQWRGKAKEVKESSHFLRDSLLELKGSNDPLEVERSTAVT